MKKAIYILFLLSALLLLAFGTALVSDKKASFELVSKTKTFIAGNSIALEFHPNAESEKPQLFIIHSYELSSLEKDLMFTAASVVFSADSGIYFRKAIAGRQNVIT